MYLSPDRCLSRVLVSCPTSRAQSFAAVGNLDCNGYSQIQNPLGYNVCADFVGEYGDEPGNDNGHYIGHDEPSIGFISTAPLGSTSLY